MRTPTRAVLTVQDHRVFCPTRGKWTAAGTVCREVMALGTCAACFQDEGYFCDVYALTADRLEAVRRLPVVVLSHYMKTELAAAGVPAGRIHVEWHPGAGLVAWGDLDGLARALRDAVVAAGPVRPTPGFERDELMARLLDVYADLA